MRGVLIGVLLLWSSGTGVAWAATRAPDPSCQEVGAPTLVGTSRAGKTRLERKAPVARTIVEVEPAGERIGRYKRRIKLGIHRSRAGGIQRTVEKWRDEIVERRTPRAKHRTIRVTRWQERSVKESYSTYRRHFECPALDPPGRDLDETDVLELETGPWEDKELREAAGEELRDGPPVDEIVEAKDGSRQLGAIRLLGDDVAGGGGNWTGINGISADRSAGAAAAQTSSTARAFSLARIAEAKAGGSKFGNADLPRLLDLARTGLDLVDVESGAVWHVSSDGTTLAWRPRVQSGLSRLIQAKVSGVSIVGDTVTVVGIFSAQVSRGTIQSRVLRGRTP